MENATAKVMATFRTGLQNACTHPCTYTQISVKSTIYIET